MKIFKRFYSQTNSIKILHQRTLVKMSLKSSLAFGRYRGHKLTNEIIFFILGRELRSLCSLVQILHKERDHTVLLIHIALWVCEGGRFAEIYVISATSLPESGVWMFHSDAGLICPRRKSGLTSLYSRGGHKWQVSTPHAPPNHPRHLPAAATSKLHTSPNKRYELVDRNWFHLC